MQFSQSGNLTSLQNKRTSFFLFMSGITPSGCPEAESPSTPITSLVFEEERMFAAAELELSQSIQNPLRELIASIEYIYHHCHIQQSLAFVINTVLSAVMILKIIISIYIVNLYFNITFTISGAILNMQNNVQ